LKRLPKVALRCSALRRFPHYAWVGLALLVLLWLLHRVSLTPHIPGTQTIAAATAMVPGEPKFGVRHVSLPHIMDDADADWQFMVDYLLAWPASLSYQDPQEQRWAVLIPRVGTRFRVLLNGHEVYNMGWNAPPEQTVNAAWFPQLVYLPSSLLQPLAVSNQIDIQVQGELLERSGLSQVIVGPYDLLSDRYALLYGWQVIGTWMMGITAVLMGFMAFFLRLSIGDRMFGLMAIASLAHSIRLLLSVLAEPPISYELYFLLHRISFTIYCGFLYLFIEDVFGLQLRKARAVAYTVLLIGPFWLFLTLHFRDYDLYRIWAGVLAASAAAMLLLVLKNTGWGRRMDRDQVLVMVVAAFTFVTGLRDFLVVQLGYPGDGDLRWMAPGSLALMFTMGWVLLQRATAAHREVKRLNESLSSTVAQRETELRATFNRLQEVLKRQVIEDERRRLMRDMHDGVGSQLVQTLNLVRMQREQLDPARLEVMIHHALEELRMTLDSLEPMEGDLSAVLGTLRRRIGPALQAAGVELCWQVTEVPHVQQLDSQGVLHLFRCLQEVFANVVKHAQASQIVVRTWHEPDRVCLDVRDNGKGLSSQALLKGHGRGLYNLQVRADLMAVRIRFYDAQPGTGIEFCFPLLLDPGLVRDL
jgi:signal transduction histidine kinase